MIFVLWANNFDEAAASVFITELRDAGLRVQVVGLHGQQIAGAHGLVLGPDVRMDEAQRYGEQAQCLIIPAPLRCLAPFETDPRLCRFIAEVQTAGARIVAADADYNATQLLSTGVEMYPPGEDVFEFARRLARSL